MNLLNWQYNPYSENNGFIFNARLDIALEQPCYQNAPPTSNLLRNISYTLQYYEKDFMKKGIPVSEITISIWLCRCIWCRLGTISGISFEPGPYTTVNRLRRIFLSGVYPWAGLKHTTPKATCHPLPLIVTSNYNQSQHVNDFRDFNAYNGFWSNAVMAYILPFTQVQERSTHWKSENDIHTGSISASFDIYPGSSDQGRHNIQIGSVCMSKDITGAGYES